MFTELLDGIFRQNKIQDSYFSDSEKHKGKTFFSHSISVEEIVICNTSTRSYQPSESISPKQ